MLWRTWIRPDRRFLVAAMGIAFAILLPVAGTLVLQGLEVRVDPQYVAYRADGGELPPLEGVLLGVRFEDQSQRVAAIVEGDPLVAPDEVAVRGDASVAGLRGTVVSVNVPSLIPDDVALVHPSTLTGTAAHVALIDEPTPRAGLIVAPARGADAFEQAGLEGLQDQTLLLVLASVPAVALVAVAFADQEAHSRARTAATLAAMGRPELGRRLLAYRITWLMAWGVALVTVLGFLLWRFGGAAFHPEDAQPVGIALAILVPGTLGGIAGLAWGIRRLGSGEARLRTPPSDSDAPGARLGFLPVILRPITLGTRLLPLLLVAGMLFALNMGFPVAAASVPAAVAGEQGEWVVGADAGITIGGNTNALVADHAWRDPAVQDIVAEIMLPTLLGGEPILVRGGHLDDLARYHFAHGIPDDATGLWLSQRVADRLDVDVGGLITIQAGHHAQIQWLPVAGTYTGGHLLKDEALLDAETARELTGVAAGRATLVRVWPDTDAALSAVTRNAADVQVIGITITPESPVSGQRVDVAIEAINMGGAAGQRVLPVRVNGLVADVVTANLGPWGSQTLHASVIAPQGPFSVEVNPSTTVQPQDGTRIQAPRIAFLPDAIPVTTTPGVSIELWRGDVLVATNTTDANGQATLAPSQTGQHIIRADGTERIIPVSSDAQRGIVDIHAVSSWLSPAQPQPGQSFRLHIAAINLGGEPGQGQVPWQYGEFHRNATFSLLSGQSGTVAVELYAGTEKASLTVGAEDYAVGHRPVEVDKAAAKIRSAGSLQVEVADRVLGDAQRSLVGLGTIALASILAVVYLGTERTIQGRQHVVRVLHGLGVDGLQIRYRAAWEAAILAAIAFTIGAIVAKLAFIGLGAIAWPRPFSHSLPDPISWLFTIQTGAAFAGAAALAGYLASGKLVDR